LRHLGPERSGVNADNTVCNVDTAHLFVADRMKKLRRGKLSSSKCGFIEINEAILINIDPQIIRSFL